MVRHPGIQSFDGIAEIREQTKEGKKVIRGYRTRRLLAQGPTPEPNLLFDEIRELARGHWRTS
jgi:hypothetical protein